MCANTSIFKENLKVIVNTIIEAIWKEKLHNDNIKQTIQAAYTEMYKGKFEEIEELEEEQLYNSYLNSRRDTYKLSSDFSESLIDKERSSHKNQKNKQVDPGNGDQNILISSYEEIRCPENNKIPLKNEGSMLDARKVLKEINDLVHDTRNRPEKNKKSLQRPFSSSEVSNKRAKTDIDRSNFTNCTINSTINEKDEGNHNTVDTKSVIFNRKKLEGQGNFNSLSYTSINPKAKTYSKCFDRKPNNEFKTSAKVNTLPSHRNNRFNFKASVHNAEKFKSNPIHKSQILNKQNSKARKENLHVEFKNNAIIEKLKNSTTPLLEDGYNVSVKRLRSRNMSSKSFGGKRHIDEISSIKHAKSVKGSKKFNFPDKTTFSNSNNLFYR